jgi:hypothetical protein
MMRLAIFFAGAALWRPGLAFAQMADMPSMPALATSPPTPSTSNGPSLSRAGQGNVNVMVMSDMAGMEMGRVKGDLGSYPMTRDASGTAWQPDSSPMEGVHDDLGGWTTMLHGYIAGVHDNQGGPRGGEKTFEESMLMGMAQRETGGGTLTFKGMFSLDPLMGKSGYPLLLATGETADGRTPLVDRQHPHDFFMELAGVYSHPLSAKVSAFLYAGLPGEPALGPATFMHRFSGMANPEAPIDHHWLDSTHITFGVITAGVVYDRLKLEVSSFRGREPDQNRWDIEAPRLDSWSVRAAWNPSPDWSLQVSRGYLHSPEQLTPLVDQDRTTASATYNRPLAHGNWQTTFAWGRDANRPGSTTDALLLESALSHGRNTLFGRAENVPKDELFADQPTSPFFGRVFNVSKFSLGYYYTLPIQRPFVLDLGGLVSKYALPSALDSAYGADPTSFMLFARFKLG